MSETTEQPTTPPEAVPPVPPDPASPAAGPKSGKGLRIALGVSVALNLLVAGLVAGALLRDGGPRERVVRDLDFGPFTEALSPKDRAELRRAFIDRSPNPRGTRAEMRSDLEAFLSALRADPFDPVALEQVMVNQQGRMAQRIELGQDLLLERLAAMDARERGAFADRLERRLRRGGPEGGRDGGRDGEGRPAE
jgi:uncharacterized membrane protein